MSSLARNKAAYTNTFLKAGTFSITAVYSGDNNVKTSSKAMSQLVKHIRRVRRSRLHPSLPSMGRP